MYINDNAYVFYIQELHESYNDILGQFKNMKTFLVENIKF